MVLCFFGQSALKSPNGLHLLHSFLNGGFREVGSLLELLQNSGPLILFLETLERPIDGFTFSYYDANQSKSPP